MSSEGLAPRQAAAAMVEAVMGGGRMLSDVAPEATDALDPAERARAQRLAVLTLRHAGRADRVLGRFLKNLPYVEVMTLLRLGTVEMLEAAAPAHGVVNDMVDLAQAREETARGAGLINAVLRKVGQVAPEDWAGLAHGRLPAAFRKRLVKAYGGAAVTAMEGAHAAEPPLDLTLRAGDAADWAARLGGEVLPTGSVRLRRPGQISALEGYDAGDWWVQDAAAALPVRALGDVTGLRVADLCAAPGGKTLQLAAGGAAVTALDVSDARMARVAENLKRTGLSAELAVVDLLEWTPEGDFDAILLDAPCTATGTIRRHPDLPFAKAEMSPDALVTLQARMIDKAVTLLAPGGRMVFCTCSLLPEEGEDQADKALARHPSLRADQDALALPGVAPEWIGRHGLRLRPEYWAERGGMDGFFIAVFQKRT